MSMCPFCNGPVLHSDPVRYEIVGWEKERKAGGTNAVELRTRTGAVAHAGCVMKAKRVHAQQTDLFSIPGQTTVYDFTE